MAGTSFLTALCLCLLRCLSDCFWFAQITLQTAGFDDDAELDQTIKKLETDLRKARKKEAAEAGDEPAEEQPSYPLVDVPDADVRISRFFLSLPSVLTSRIAVGRFSSREA